MLLDVSLLTSFIIDCQCESGQLSAYICVCEVKVKSHISILFTLQSTNWIIN